MKFEEIAKIDVSKYIEKKNGLSYLSWANAWREFCKVYPGATYEVKKNADGLPLFGNDKTGYMVYTTVTVEGLTHEMWLSIMDFKNKAMLNPDTTNINKAVMRCLTKNLAMHGLGLYIYAGEDLPDESDIDRPTHEEEERKQKGITAILKLNSNFNREELEEMSIDELSAIYKKLKNGGKE